MNLGVASRDPGLVAEIRALLLKHKVLFFRDQDITRAGARRVRPALRRARGSPGGRQRPGQSGPRAHLQVARRADRPLRERMAHRRHMARKAAVRLRAALRRVPAGGRRHDVGEHGRGVQPAARAHQDPDRRAARAAQHRGDVRRGNADREAPRAEGAVSRTPSIRSCARTRRPARRSCSSTPSRRTSPTSTRRRTFASARTTRPGASQLLNYLISQAFDSGIPGALALEAQQHGDVGQPQHAALRRDGLPALPPQDGTRRDHRRQALLNAAQPLLECNHVSPPDGPAR